MLHGGYLDQGPKKRSHPPNLRKRGLPLASARLCNCLQKARAARKYAVQLGLSVKTAETHRANIMRRLGCHSVTEVVRYAVRNNIIEP